MGRTGVRPNPPSYGSTDEAPQIVKVTSVMVDNLRAQTILLMSIQLVISFIGMLMMFFVDDLVWQITAMAFVMSYSAAALFVVATQWAMFLARIMMLN